MGERTLTPQQISEAKDAFDLFDTTGTGVIEQKELKIALMTLGFQTSKDDIKKVAVEVNATNNTINFDDFKKIIIALLPTRDTRKELEEAFQLFDIDHTGKISSRNLKEVISDLGQTLTEQEISEIISEADKDMDGEISLEEFIDLIQDNAIF